MNPSSAVFGWAIIFATFFGPIFAVLVTRYVDKQRERHQRRLYVFRTLMGTRKSQLSPEHIGALNLIEIDFHGETKVINAWKQYFQNLSTTPDTRNPEQFFRTRQGLFVKLLSEMSKPLKIEIEQLDMFEGGYFPQASADLEAQQAAIRKLFTEISAGTRGLPISTFQPAQGPQPK